MPISDYHAPDWMDDGLCTQIGVEIFFPPDKDKSPTRQLYRNAKRVCSSCPVKTECLEHFLHEPYGVFGETTPPERKVIINKRKREARLRLEENKRKAKPKGNKNGKVNKQKSIKEKPKAKGKKIIKKPKIKTKKRAVRITRK